MTDGILLGIYSLFDSLPKEMSTGRAGQRAGTGGSEVFRPADLWAKTDGPNLPKTFYYSVFETFEILNFY